MGQAKRASRAGRAFAAACLALCCAAVLGLAGCGGPDPASSGSQPPSQESGTVAFTDSAGRTVELPADVERVAVTGPISQMVMLTLAPEKMVGLSNELSGAEAKYVGAGCAGLDVLGQIYGGKGDFNKEAVANAGPQVVIDIGEAKSTIAEDLDAIQEAIGIPCVHVEASFDTYDRAYRELGELLGVQERAEELADYCADAYETTRSAVATVPEADRVRAAYLLGDAGLNAMAKGSFQATVIDLVADNVAEFDQPGATGQGNEASFEQIALWDPEMIVFAPGSVYETAGSDEAWRTLSAIEQGNYYVVPGEPYNWVSSPPGVNQVLGYQWFARLCYPDAFDDDIADVAKGYYGTFYGYDLSDGECEALTAGSVPRR